MPMKRTVIQSGKLTQTTTSMLSWSKMSIAPTLRSMGRGGNESAKRKLGYSLSFFLSPEAGLANVLI